MTRVLMYIRDLPMRAWATGAAMLTVAAVVGGSVWLVNNPPGVDPANGVELAKVHQVQSQFPPGFQVTQTDTKTITEDYAKQQQDPMEGATFLPAECADQANAAQSMPIGATIEGLRGESADRFITVAAMRTPDALPPVPDMPQCDAVVFVQPGYIDGLTTVVGAPSVGDGIATQGVRVSASVTDGNGQRFDTVQYAYTATLDDHHIVAVTISGTPPPGSHRDIDPTPAQQLFTAAVAVVRAT